LVGINLKDYIRSTNNKHYASDKVERYKLDVFELRAKDFSYEKIGAWLKEKGMTVSTKTVERYINKHKTEYEDFLKKLR